VAPGRLADEDRQALTDLIARYALACDRRDVPAVVACFTPDGIFEYEGGAVRVQGADALSVFYQSALTEPGRASDGSTHLMGNVLLEAAGDGARGEIGALACHVYSGTGRTMVRGLHYVDDFAHTDRGWLIAHRRHQAVWQSELTGAVSATAPVPAAG
jgi:ketosteroid isomerase-like protein